MDRYQARNEYCWALVCEIEHGYLRLKIYVQLSLVEIVEAQRIVVRSNASNIVPRH